MEVTKERKLWLIDKEIERRTEEMVRQELMRKSDKEIVDLKKKVLDEINSIWRKI